MVKLDKILLALAAVLWIPAVSQPPALNAMEYFFDTDPGFGGGIPVTISPGTEINPTFNLDITTLDAGIHKAYIRTRDADGAWSHAYIAVLCKVDNPAAGTDQDLVEMEYFYDTDPGFGNATPVPVTSGLTISESFTISLSGLDRGFHKVYFRVKDENNKWSLAYIHNIVRFTSFSPPSLPELQAMEYFFDSDPGFGNGTTVSITPGYMIDETFVVDMSALTPGYHKLYIRTMDANNDWGLAYIHNLVKVSTGDLPGTPDLVAMEYFIDEDPGFGNGSGVSVTPGPTVDMVFEADVSGVSPGEHDLFVRVLDENGAWSLMSVLPFIVSEAELTAFLEGPFNGTAMGTTLNSSGIIPLEQPFSTPPWNYSGSEAVASIPNSDVVDWILLETRHAPDAASADQASVSSQHAGFLLNNGSIVGIDGVSNLKFNTGSIDGNFLVVRHRNHLEMLSAQELTFSSGLFQYDFSTSADKAYGSGQKLLGSGIYGMFVGDLNGDGIISEADLADEWDTEAGSAGYRRSDINMDGESDNVDKNEGWLPNNGTASTIPD